MKAYMWVVMGVVAAVVVFGFFVAGSPQNRRTAKFDERRVNDLSVIQSQVITYWQNKNKLPANLGELSNDLLGITIPTDPKTKTPYEYNVLGNLKFRLCATFETISEEEGNVGRYKVMPMSYPYPGPGGETETWQHGIGQTCFERTIDPDYFKPRPL